MHDHLLTTSDLVRRARDGEEPALETLFARYRPRLTRWISGRLPAAVTAALDTEDLVQETLARTLSRLDHLAAAGAFPAYVYRALLNRLRDVMRRHRARPRTVALAAVEPRVEPADDGVSPIERLLGSELLERYERAIALLSSRDRAAVVGRFEWGMAYADLALEIGAPSPDAARMTVSRALLKLSRRICHERG